tara:strand:+ start:187 stop:558 length:372 start_codon:yes stop_codon:yes gene_type:complete
MNGLMSSNEPDLHLNTSVRSFRSEKVSNFVHSLIEGDAEGAKAISTLLHKYPIALTRNLETARNWLRFKSRGTERYGLVASSNAQRLRAIGPDVRVKVDPANWFLNDNEDVRSSYSMEDVATK